MKRRMARTALLAGAGALLGVGVAAGGALAGPGATGFQDCLKTNGGVSQKNGPVAVCKTVSVTKITTYTWSLTKAAAPTSLSLGTGQGAPVSYTLTATPTAVVAWRVSGTVVVQNEGANPVTNLNVTDALAIPGEAEQSATLATGDSLPGGGGFPEKSYPYSFDVATAAPQNGTNTAAVTYGTGGTASFGVPVAFDGPNGNEIAYNRQVTLTDAFGTLGPGITVTGITNPGPFTVDATNAATQTVPFGATVSNASMACGTTSAAPNTATVTSISTAPEGIKIIDVPLSAFPSGPAVDISANASVSVSAPACAPTPPPAVIGGGTTTPTKPKPRPKRKVRPVCVLPSLGATIRGPKLVNAGDRVVFGVRITNTSRKAARRVTALYPIPSGFSIVRTSRPFTMSGGRAVIRVGDLSGGRSRAVRITLKADTTSSGLKRSRVSVTGRGNLGTTNRIAPATCVSTAASTAPIRVLPVAARVQPAVTG